MAFTYDLTTTRGQVRLALADTVEAEAVFTDAEVDHFIDLGGTVAASAIEGLRVLLVDAARRHRRFVAQGLTLDTKGQTDAIRAAILELGGLPTAEVLQPSALPSDEGWVEIYTPT
jgi:hypothetical protein